MKRFQLELNPELIASRIPSKLIKRMNANLNNVTELPVADEHTLCFLDNDDYLEEAKQTKAGLLLVKTDFDPEVLPSTNLLLVDKPYIAFMMIVKQWMALDEQQFVSKIAASAKISKTAKLPDKIIIAENVVIGDNVVIGTNTIIDANTVIMNDVKIGRDCHFFPNVTIYPDTIIHDRVILHAGTVIGADGFGYLLHEGKQEKIPQLGYVIIEDDVEIGANSCVDRATLGSTIIGKGTKIDNLVQVGHNVNIGENTILCAQVGIAGSSEIGDIVYLAGQVGVGDHVKIGNKAMIGAQSGVKGVVMEGARMFGTPALDASLRMRIIAVEKHLPEIWKHICNSPKEEDK
jgi:UDP-3-O-[3-hydroxymyristoyl] glucosamine N-acyltransferase